MIAASRIDITAENRDLIIDTNSPFELKPDSSFKANDGRYKVAVILIHGTVDSPMSCRDIGLACQQAGALVRAPLLPGAGTVTADQVNIKSQEWIDAVNAVVNDTANYAEKIIIGGLSLGSPLGALAYLQNPNKIHGFIFLSPLIHVSLIHFKLIKIYQAYTKLNWLHRFQMQVPFVHPCRYLSPAVNVNYQARMINEMLLPELAKIQHCPMFFVTAKSDEALNYPENTKFFSQNKHPHSKAIYYKSVIDTEADPRVAVRSYVYPEYDILNFSHISCAFTPSNLIYGPTSPYPLPQAYDFRLAEDVRKRQIKFGSDDHGEKDQYCLLRTGFNPDFDYLSAQLQQFIAKL